MNSNVDALVDAKTQGEQGPSLGDDDFYEVDLPFPFSFYNQLKTQVKISSNGYITFSGEHIGYGGTAPIPNSRIPNDMIAVYWTDLDPEHQGGSVYTLEQSGGCAYGVASGEICCAASCGTCGGSGCQGRPGGASACCAGQIRDAGVSCADNGGTPPCVSDGGELLVVADAALCYDNMYDNSDSMRRLFHNSMGWDRSFWQQWGFRSKF
eukprot:SAG31_NODE_487_length_14980_cov_9.526376_11_plen_209_part_00